MTSIIPGDRGKQVVYDPRAGAVAERIVYVALGKRLKRNEHTLLWAIQNFCDWKICILHVHKPDVFTARFNDTLIEEWRAEERKKMQNRLNNYLHICHDHGVEAEKVHVEMDSIEEGIVDLIRTHNIKTLIMGANQRISIRPPQSRKGNYVKTHAPLCTTIYFVRDGCLISKWEAVTVSPATTEKEQPISFFQINLTASEAVCKITRLDKLYTEELRKRKAIEEELQKMKQDSEAVIKEAQDQKGMIELKIAAQEQLINETQQKLVIKEETLGKLYTEELRKREAIEEEHEKMKHDNMKVIKEAQDQKAIMELKIAAQEQQISETQQKMMENDSRLLRLREILESAQELVNQSLEPHQRTESVNFSTMSYSEIVESTNGLDPSMILRETEHGNIFEGLLGSTTVTIRMFFTEALFKREVEALRKFRHPNIGNMLGACQDAFAVVYEHLSSGNLEECLACTNQSPPLSWQGRIKIALGLCSALVFLHCSRPFSIVHCALRPSCILLDSHFTCKLIGFDFSHILSHGENSTSSSSRTYATSTYTSIYTDPAFLETRKVSPKSDVYSFGLILLQMLTGMMPSKGLVDEMRRALDEDRIKPLLDDSAGVWPYLQAHQLAQLGLRCCDPNPSMRPDLKLEVWRVIQPMVAHCGSALTFMPSDPPSYFLCPISYEVMRDPQVAADGHTYEAEVLKEWIDSGHNTSPMTNLPFEHNNLTPNLPLRSAIQEWLQLNPSS